MRVGLVLEGGAMRGMYTAGVLDVFMAHGITVDCVVGVSAGALFGVNYLSGQIGRVIRYNKRFNGDKNYLGLRPLFTEGNIVNTKYAYEDVPHQLDPFDNEQFKKSPMSFFAVVTNVITGKPEYMQITDPFKQMDVLRASGSMPFVSRMVNINQQLYLDGGISDSIPFRWLANQGYKKQVVILTRDLDYKKSPMPKLPIQMEYRNYPELSHQLLNRHANYNEAVGILKQWEKEGKAFVIRPSQKIDIGRIEKNPDRLQEVYDLGVSDAKKCLKALKKYLESTKQG